jgi:hypothetical protein
VRRVFGKSNWKLLEGARDFIEAADRETTTAARSA